MSSPDVDRCSVEECDISLERDGFLRSLVAHLSRTLEDLVGLEEAQGFISVVGQLMGEEIASEYKKSLGVEGFTKEQVSDILVDLKRRIKGDFYVIEATDDKLVLGNRVCPFGDRMNGHESLCMMTSNVFGTITAQNLGYAKVDIQESIAQGHSGCRVVVHLRQTEEAEQAPGREYFEV